MSKIKRPLIFTIGHSTHSYETFLSLLRSVNVNAIADVRSSPYSRHFAHFNEQFLKNELRSDQIAYSYLGEELGGRPQSHLLYTGGTADYEKMSQASLFQRGIERLVNGVANFNIALMCTEHNPLDCHRCLLVGRVLSEKHFDVRHIIGINEIISQEKLEEELLLMVSSNTDDLFLSEAERLNIAYRSRAMKVAYSDQKFSD